VKDKTKKTLNGIVPGGKQDVYMVALLETLEEIKKLIEDFLKVIKGKLV